MRRKHSPLAFISLSLAAFSACALALYFFAINAPKSTLGTNLLRWQYSRADDKNVALRDYRARIYAHGGGYVTPEAEALFAARLNDGNAKEVAAIARFYASQAGGREGDFGQQLSERARQRLVDAILRDWRTYPEKDAWRAFVFIETLRQNQYLGKARIRGPVWPDSYDKLAPHVARFEAWNRRYRATPIPQRPFPLAGSGYVIEGL